MIDWSKPVYITWQKAKCPICGEPTGQKSKCFEIPPSMPAFDLGSMMGVEGKESWEEDKENTGQSHGNKLSINQTIEKNGTLYRIFDESCLFRRYNTFNIELNYPISGQMTLIISAIEGVENIFVESKYKAVITIGNSFDEKLVKNDINQAIEKFVKDHNKDEN